MKSYMEIWEREVAGLCWTTSRCLTFGDFAIHLLNSKTYGELIGCAIPSGSGWRWGTEEQRVLWALHPELVRQTGPVRRVCPGHLAIDDAWSFWRWETWSSHGGEPPCSNHDHVLDRHSLGTQHERTVDFWWFGVPGNGVRVCTLDGWKDSPAHWSLSDFFRWTGTCWRSRLNMSMHWLGQKEWRGTTSMQHLVEPFLPPFSMQGP